MTKTGFGFVIAGVFIYFLASQTQIGWLYLFDAIIWGLLILSALLPWYSLRSLQIDRQVLWPTSAWQPYQLNGPLEDETIEVRVTVTNHGRLTKYLIRVLEACPFAEPDQRHKAFLIPHLNPKSTAVFSYTATAYRRGYYPSANVTLQSSGPLGLMVRRHTLPLPLNLTVYPAHYQMTVLLTEDIAWAERGQAVKSQAATEFYSSRDYQYGDPLRHIHWRNTARLGHFMLKEFEETSQGSVTVIFDTGQDFGVGRETTLEYSIKIAASLARLCADFGRGIDIIAGKTPLFNAGWRESMDYLAHLKARDKNSLAELNSSLLSRQRVVAVVSATETGLITALSQLAQTREMVVILLEGFTLDETPPEFRTRLKGRHLNIITCRRGDLEGAIKELADVLSGAGELPTTAG